MLCKLNDQLYFQNKLNLLLLHINLRQLPSNICLEWHRVTVLKVVLGTRLSQLNYIFILTWALLCEQSFNGKLISHILKSELTMDKKYLILNKFLLHQLQNHPHGKFTTFYLEYRPFNKFISWSSINGDEEDVFNVLGYSDLIDYQTSFNAF
jgi:hypothetical protein